MTKLLLLAARAAHNHRAAAKNYFDPARLGAGITLTNSSATAVRTSGGWASVAGVTKHSAGKWYAECSDDVNPGSGGMMFGAAPTSFALTAAFPGMTATSYGEQPSNTGGTRTYNNNVQTSYSGFIVAGGSGRIAIDFDAGKVWFGDSNSGGRWYKGDPATGATPSYTFTPGLELTLMLGLFLSTQQCTLRNNAGENTMTIPTGFTMWS